MSYKETMIKKYGSEELWKQHLRDIASVGGKNGTGHAYAHGKVSPVENGRKGGSISKRRPKADIIEGNQ